MQFITDAVIHTGPRTTVTVFDLGDELRVCRSANTLKSTAGIAAHLYPSPT